MSAPLTPAERALARVLVAWDESPSIEDETNPLWKYACDVTIELQREGYADSGCLTERARGLVARLRAEEQP